MSRESLEWLNRNVLVGYVAERGNAWHYSPDLQPPESTCYPGAIPPEDVIRRLFNWDIIEAPCFAEVDGRRIQVPRKALLRSDTLDVIGVNGQSYQYHVPRQWLVDEVLELIGTGTGIGSAGLLELGAKQWVQIDLEKTQKVQGVRFRPHLLAVGSTDGSMATTYRRAVTLVVCDNTLSAALGERNAPTLKIRHTRNSAFPPHEVAAQALDLIIARFAVTIDTLLGVEVTDRQFGQFLDRIEPVPEEEGHKRTRTMNRRMMLTDVYLHDPRVAPWAGSAFGVVQAVNTFAHYYAEVRGRTRAERNRAAAATGRFDDLDRSTVEALSSVLGRDLAATIDAQVAVA